MGCCQSRNKDKKDDEPIENTVDNIGVSRILSFDSKVISI